MANKFGISAITAKKYYNLSDDEVPNPNKPKKNRLSNKSKINGYRNMVYKMLKDKISPVTVKEYVKYKGFTGSDRSLEFFITCISINNFNKQLNIMSFSKCIEVPGLITIKRNDLLKYITTKNTKINKDKNIEKHFSLLKEKYPIISELSNVYNDFYNIFHEKNESLLDEFIKKYEDLYFVNDRTGEVIQPDDNIENIKSGIQGFINSIKKDIAPVKAAISLPESSGFVEGNNNKFKLVKRILYGRCNLVNLFKKCFSIFSLKTNINIFKLLNFNCSIPYYA